MMIASTLLMIVGLSSGVIARDYPVFTLNCADYPDVCDTHCYAIACSGTASNFRDVNRYLHYAPNADTNFPNPQTSQSESQYRRQAIGCATSGCTQANSANQCDEFPYASTFDGGLGHGTALKAFYNAQKIFGLGSKFQVGFDEANVDRAYACNRVREGGPGICADIRANGDYEVRLKVPGTNTFCPRTQKRRRTLSNSATTIDEDEPVMELGERVPDWDGHVNVTFHAARTEHGHSMLFPFGGAPTPGTKVFHVEQNGTVIETTLL
ncbi:hypothetical protein BKA62DRAFT_831331 [Auriculariales sp. MPI-PUGE-AT-0066]|nr:hypothetical protein BKA62DRAFT_831331 [Auriculariales sp. MPI-PUGE-AT-0066]